MITMKVIYVIMFAKKRAILTTINKSTDIYKSIFLTY